jgi:hypothetical protein
MRKAQEKRVQTTGKVIITAYFITYYGSWTTEITDEGWLSCITHSHSHPKPITKAYIGEEAVLNLLILMEQNGFYELPDSIPTERNVPYGCLGISRITVNWAERQHEVICSTGDNATMSAIFYEIWNAIGIYEPE